MDVIYLDSLFGLNLLIDYCLVLASARVCGVVLRRWRYALAALIGALYAALMVLPGCGWLANGVMKLALGAAMALIAFGGEAHLVRCTVVFFAVSAAFGGAVYAASMLAGVSPGSGALVTVSGRVLALSFAACYAAVSLVFRRRAKAVADAHPQWEDSMEQLGNRLYLMGFPAEPKTALSAEIRLPEGVTSRNTVDWRLREILFM